MIKDVNMRLVQVMTRFLQQKCISGNQYSIDDDPLFSCFLIFWRQAPEWSEHPSLLGQFRVELIRRGYRAEPGGKWPHWSGLTLREDSGCA